MDHTRVAPLVGIVASIGVIAWLVGPYLLIEPASAIGTYYETGAITPLITGMFALLSIVIFAAGMEDRTDPALAAGVTLVMGLFAFVIALLWALTVPRELITSIDVTALFIYHRGAFVLTALAMPAAAAWYARSMRLI